MEPNEAVLDWVRKNSQDPLVAALRVLATSHEMEHEEAFSHVLLVVAERAGVPEFYTNAEACATERAIREWFGAGREIITGQDVWTFLLCTIRYSMGRMTYMPSECVDLYRRYQKHLLPSQRLQIKEEVATELRRVEGHGEFLGHECDHRSWQQLVRLIEGE